jgi:hypothetical protein
LPLLTTAKTTTPDPENRRCWPQRLIAANYDFKVVKVFGAYSKDKGLNSAPLNSTLRLHRRTFAPSQDSSDALIGLTAPVARLAP